MHQTTLPPRRLRPGRRANLTLNFNLRLLLWSALALLIALAALYQHARGYLPFIADDSLISLRYAKRLLHGQGLTWTDGERVEGYSNLLWVLACAGLGRLGVDLIAAARILGFCGMGAALGAVAWAVRPDRFTRFLAALAGMLLLALADPIACWAIGGLEQGLLAGLLAWALVLGLPLARGRSTSLRAAVAPGVLLGLVALTRPDGPLFAVAAALAIVLCNPRRRASWGQAALLAAVSASFYLAQLAFRLAYYHDWAPNTAYVKMQPSLHRCAVGLHYLIGAALASKWAFAAGAFGWAALWRFGRRGQAALPGLAAALWGAYLVFIGGDIFPCHRHAVPLLVCAALLAALALAAAFRRSGPRARLATGAAVIACLGWLAFSHLAQGRGKPAIDEFWEWDGKVVAEGIVRAFGAERPLMAVDAAGCLPYFSDLPCIDMLGLNDRHIARHRRPNHIEWMVGHDLGDGPYVLARRPDIIIFNSPWGHTNPMFYSGAEMFLKPEFKRAYKAATFMLDPARPWRLVAYLRVESPKVGLRRTAEAIVIPAHLMMDHPQHPAATLDGDGRPTLEATAETPAVIKDLAIDPGKWTARADATTTSGEPLLLAVNGREVALSRDDAAPAVIDIPGDAPTSVTLALRPSQGAALLRTLRLEKAH